MTMKSVRTARLYHMWAETNMGNSFSGQQQVYYEQQLVNFKSSWTLEVYKLVLLDTALGYKL